MPRRGRGARRGRLRRPLDARPDRGPRRTGRGRRRGGRRCGRGAARTGVEGSGPAARSSAVPPAAGLPPPARVARHRRAAWDSWPRAVAAGAGRRPRMLVRRSPRPRWSSVPIGGSVATRRARPAGVERDAGWGAQVLARSTSPTSSRSSTPRAVTPSVVQTKAGPRLKVDVSSAGAAGRATSTRCGSSTSRSRRWCSVGILAPGEDEFVIPDGRRHQRLPVVDISVQQPGDPRHSGDSVLRGTISG